MPAGNCLAGCMSKYKCGILRTPGGDRTPDGMVMSPFVRAKFTQGGGEITVGNKSAPGRDHHACIIGFEYGASTGSTGSLEIIDEQGGSFVDFVDSIVKCVKKEDDQKTTVDIQWGWIAIDCNGSTRLFGAGFTVKLKLMGLEVSFSNGKIKYNIDLKDLGQVIFASREDLIFGEEGNPMPLKEAIRELGRKRAPKITFEFLRKGKDGKNTEWDFFDFPGEGPPCVWDADQENIIASVQKWIEPFETDKRKGIFITADDENPANFILWEDTKPRPGEADECKPATSLGTFLVNAGKCSNVLEFNPKITWASAFAEMSNGGASGGAGTAKGEKQEKDAATKPQGDTAGTQEGITNNRYAWDCHGPKNSIKKIKESQKKHHRAQRGQSIVGVTGELKIVGIPSPEFVRTKGKGNEYWMGKFVSIVVINPFHIFSTGCGEWLAKPGCNSILSTKGWRVLGVNHHISNGQYTTTLKVEADKPGIEALPGEPLGGTGNEGAQLGNTC